MQQDGYPIILPDINTIIMKDDILWVMGSNSNVGALVAESYIEEAVEEQVFEYPLEMGVELASDGETFEHLVVVSCPAEREPVTA